jgi:hypothetical protein
MTAPALKTVQPRPIARPQPISPLGGNFSLDHVTRTPKKLPNRILLHAMEKWGKTSFAAQFVDPIFLMTRGETGLWTLIQAEQLEDDIPHFPQPAEAWTDIKLALNELIVKEHPYKTFVLDTLNGSERLLHEYVVEKEFNGEWGEKGFMAFHKGYDIAIKDWLELLLLLDRLRDKGMTIVLLCHTKVEKFTNPEGPDYDRYQPDVHKKTWSATHKWADMILFGMFETFVTSAKSGDKKGKADGGQTRIIKTVRHAAYDAGNRHGLPEEIECGESPEEAYGNFAMALKQASTKSQSQPKSAPNLSE